MPTLNDIKKLHTDNSKHLNLYALNYTLDDGSAKTYEIASYQSNLTENTLGNGRKGVVLIVMDASKSFILLQREFRMGVNQTIINLPSGFIDNDETIAEAAIRELQEETGLLITKIEQMFPASFISPPVTDQQTWTLFCQAAIDEPKPSDDPKEPIEAFWQPIRFLPNLLEDKSVKFSARTQSLLIGIMIGQSLI